MSSPTTAQFLPSPIVLTLSKSLKTFPVIK